ncbi:hypothetical protein TWF102_011142 [Orbilia oligospora]|uniref:Leucine rich repeat n=1 Tax=Orbilia oligospora TaxID=2813651 RepID=A0A7C8J819_ORBOL|nr:hypothetical protein TWF102_011142 [Orbilia oligospora]KAF3092716.1 hypothetical protein TWF103_011169 [Orbilia oligospora]KAF3095200.1 hypothetical protein TWF706_008048 [Orbilia oligospora]KAF3150122.1 hypothetical protein TWF594_010011 [Orbilia oligospora]
MASWLQGLEDDWISDGQLPAKLQTKTPVPKNASAKVHSKPTPPKSFIPRPSSRKTPIVPKHLVENSTILQDDSPSERRNLVQEPSPTITPQGTVQKLTTNLRPIILVDGGNEDLFSPTRLESLFEPISDGSCTSCSSENLPSHPSEQQSGGDASGITQGEGLMDEQSSESYQPNDKSETHAAPHSSSMLEYESEDPLERSAWNSTPPPFIAWRPTESSTNQDTSLFREEGEEGEDRSSVIRDEEYINSISTSAFSDQSPGLNGLLHFNSRNELPRHFYGNYGNRSSRQHSPEQSVLSHNNQLYFTTPDRKVLWRINSEDASLELPGTSPRECPPLKLFSSAPNSFTKTAVHGQMSQIDHVNSPYDEKTHSETSGHPETSLANRSKRLLDGTPASAKRTPSKVPPKAPRSDSLHPPSPVKESQPKRQKLNLSSNGELTDVDSESTGEEFDSDESVVRNPSARIARTIAGFEPRESTSKLLIEPEIDFSRSPHPNFLSDPHSAFTRAASLHSLNVILASKVKHMMPRKVGSMVFDEERQVWRHENDVIDSMRRDLLMDLTVGERSPPVLEREDPFEEISDLATSLSSRLVLSHDQKGVTETAPPLFNSSGFSAGQSRNLDSGIATKSSKLIEPELSVGNTSPTPKEGVRPISPNIDLKKGNNQRAFGAEGIRHLDHEQSSGKDGFGETYRGTVDQRVGASSLDTATPTAVPPTINGSSLVVPQTQNTPCQSLRQYTISVQANGAPLNRTMLSMRKPESSFWNTPLTDITYHFLEADSRMQSGFPRGYHSRNSRQLRKFPSDKTSLALKSMVRHLTDNDMFGPYWDQNKALQIQKQGLEHLQDLASFHPNLVEVNLEHNQLTHLTGMPSTVRDLKVAGNLLSSLTAWAHLTNIQFLDLSSNRLDNLSGLSGLIHLRDLKADDNQITSLDGVLHLDGLVKLRLRLNHVRGVTFGTSNLKHLKSLDLGSNKIERIEYLHRLPELSYLNLDSNNLIEFTITNGLEVRGLRTLDLSRNSLRYFTVRPFPNIKTLYLDSNKLEVVDGIPTARYLDSFSFRSQAGSSTINIPFNSLYELRKVYASGNPISSLSLLDYFANLQYLELASCNLRILPPNFGRLMTNIRVVNLNNNALSDIKPLYGILRLKKLFLMGNRISNLQKLNNMLRFLPFLSELDLRHNPLTLGFYAILSQSVDLTRSETSGETIDPSPFLMQHQDKESDEMFQRSMTEDTAVARRCYDILIGEQCPQMAHLDGLMFDIKHKLRHDLIWERMTKLGLLFEAKYTVNSDPTLDS